MKYERIARYLFAFSAACMIGLFTGCAKEQTTGGTESTDGPREPGETAELPGGAYVSDEAEENGQEQEAGTGDSAEEDEVQAEGQELDDSPSTTVDASDDFVVGRILTTDELQEYTEWIQERSNYGFLLSEWQDPAQINLFEVFYNGAGISHQATDEEKEALLKRYDQEEIYTDVFAVGKDDVNAFLLEKVGLSYDEIAAQGNASLEDIYFSETDSFCMEVGDTNYCTFVCSSGAENEEGTILILHFQGNDWVKECETRIMKESRVFLSNHIIAGDILNGQ